MKRTIGNLKECIDAADVIVDQLGQAKSLASVDGNGTNSRVVNKWHIETL